MSEYQTKFEEELKQLEKAPRTFIEIMKVHKNEVAMANLLAYFFRPQEKHGLGNLFIKTLLNCKLIGLKNKNEKSKIPFGKLEMDSWNNANVKTEVATKKEDIEEDKRIDILIESSKHIICIEFKINHDLNNPLNVYQTFAEQKALKENKACLFLVLTPIWKKPVGPAEGNTPFKQVMLSDFIVNVEKLAPKKESSENILFRQLIQTVKNRNIRHKLEDKIKEILITKKLKIESVILPNDEYWADLIGKMKLKELAEKKVGNYHSNSKVVSWSGKKKGLRFELLKISIKKRNGKRERGLAKTSTSHLLNNSIN